jgi:hypothetical protein
LYYPNWHITLTKSRNKTASATAASHHELCMMPMAIKPVKKKNKEQERTFSLRALVTAPLATLFFYLPNEKTPNSKIK